MTPADWSPWQIKRKKRCMVKLSPLENSLRDTQKTCLFHKSGSHDAKFSSLYFCCEHSQVRKVIVNMALFENSYITLLRYYSGIFLLVPFLSSNIRCHTIDIPKNTWGGGVFIFMSLLLHDHVHFSLLLSRFPGCLQQDHLTLMFFFFFLY